MIDDGEVGNVVQLSKKTGIPQPQIRIRMQLLRLTPKIVRYIKHHEDGKSNVYISERRLCGIALLSTHEDQLAAFKQLISKSSFRKLALTRVSRRASVVSR